MIDVSESTRRTALNLLVKAEDIGFSIGKNPMSLVAAAVYLATCTNNEKKTQVEIARVCGVSNVSVRNITKLFKVKLGLTVED
jgi:transcription initiation factor TFIIB